MLPPQSTAYAAVCVHAGISLCLRRWGLLEEQECGPQAGVCLSLSSFISGFTYWKKQLRVQSCVQLWP